MRKVKSSWALLEYAPPLLLMIYVLFSLFLFQFGDIEWLVSHTGLVTVYVLAIYVSFLAGYHIIFRRWKKSGPYEVCVRSDSISDKWVLWVFRIGAIAAIIYRFAWVLFTFGSDIIAFLKAPGAAYDLTNFVGRLYRYGDRPYPMWLRWLGRVNTLSSGLHTAAVCVGACCFKKFRLFDKLLFGVMLFSDVLYMSVYGKQSLYLVLLLQILVGIGANCAAELYVKRTGMTFWQAVKEKRRLLLAYGGGILLMVCCIVLLMIRMQNDRAIQIGIREQLYEQTIEETGAYPPPEQLEYFFLESVEIRTGYDVANSFLGETVKNRYGEFVRSHNTLEQPQEENETEEPGPSTQPAEKAEEPAEEDAADITETFHSLGEFFVTKDASLLDKLPGNIRYGLQTVDMYITQGYASLSMAFDLDFHWTYFIGHSLYLSQLADKYLGTDIMQNTYPAQNEAENGWSKTTYYNTLYTWLASDLTFVGVIVLFFFLGMLFAELWRSVIAREFLMALPLFYYFLFCLICAPMNNLMFNTMGAIIETGMIVLIYCAKVVYERIKGAG